MNDIVDSGRMSFVVRDARVRGFSFGHGSIHTNRLTAIAA